MEKLTLRTLEEDDKDAHGRFIKEFLDAGERIIPGNAYWPDLSFVEWLRKTEDVAKGQNLPKGWVPSTVYFLFREDERKILGAIDIRHPLNDHLLRVGGNIGYGIAPSERRKGYGSRMLSMALEKCKHSGLSKVLITCDCDNTNSAKTIQKNGGILESEITNEQGTMKKRFWIKL